ncbi:class I SAM-dependent methyltransferase [Candidatus Omnitrophota bacterium]
MFIDRRFDIVGAGKELDSNGAQTAFTELEIYLNKSIERISQEYWHYRETEEKERENIIIQTDDREEVLNYYRTSSHFLYSLLYWEALRAKQNEFKKLYLGCRKFKINRLLDFGGGIGGLSIFMSQRGLRCDYLDVPGKSFDFAQWRFNRRNLRNSLYSDSRSLPDLAYDAVVAYDVLEHLFDIEEAIKEIGRTLKNHGYFISRSSFATRGAMHLPKNEKFKDMKIFDAVMTKSNFSFLGQLKPDYFSHFLKNLDFKNFLYGVRIKKRLKYGGNFIVYQKL